MTHFFHSFKTFQLHETAVKITQIRNLFDIVVIVLKELALSLIGTDLTLCC